MGIKEDKDTLKFSLDEVILTKKPGDMFSITMVGRYSTQTLEQLFPISILQKGEKLDFKIPDTRVNAGVVRARGTGDVVGFRWDPVANTLRIAEASGSLSLKRLGFTESTEQGKMSNLIGKRK